MKFDVDGLRQSPDDLSWPRVHGASLPGPSGGHSITTLGYLIRFFVEFRGPRKN